jgi:hypothetical protein
MAAKHLVIALLLGSLLVACTAAGPDRSLEDKIREYLYRYQPTTGQQFVKWANRNLAGYSSRQVYRALYDEAKFQADLGHPNVVGVLSFAAKAWAEEKGLQYDPGQWMNFQQEAISNLRSEPGELQLWPTEQKP